MSVYVNYIVILEGEKCYGERYSREIPWLEVEVCSSQGTQRLKRCEEAKHAGI